MASKKIGLALGSGSARGWAHIGVIRSLQEAGVGVDLACGTSIGALVAGALAAGFLDRLDEWVHTLSWADILRFIDVTFPWFGLIEGERITGYFRENLSDARIEDLDMPFAAVATDLKTGREVIIRKGPLMDAIRASISMPGIFTPCRYGARWLVDGGLVDPVPVSLCRTLGADIVIAVDLNADIMEKRRSRKSPVDRIVQGAGKNNPILPAKLISFLYGKLPPVHPSVARLFAQGKEARGPSIFEVMATSIHIMQYQITRQRLAMDKPEILVVPRLAHIGLLEFNRAGEAVREGYEAMNRLLPRLRNLAG